MVAGGGHSSPSSPDRSRVSPSFAPGGAKRPRAMRVAGAYDVRMRTPRFFATVRDSGITHSHFAAQKTKDGIVDRFRDAVGRRPDVDAKTPEVRIVVRIVRDECAVSLDTSGERLNRRGDRALPSGAALKETL